MRLKCLQKGWEKGWKSRNEKNKKKKNRWEIILGKKRGVKYTTKAQDGTRGVENYLWEKK